MCMPNEAIAGIDEQAVGQVRPSKVSSNAEGLVGSKASPVPNLPNMLFSMPGHVRQRNQLS